MDAAQITYESMQRIAEGGFNLLMVSPVAPTRGNKLLDWAQQLELKVTLTDPYLSPYRVSLEADIQEITASYKDHPALWGYYIIDEPGADQFADLARMNRLLLQNDPAHFPYINLPQLCRGQPTRHVQLSAVRAHLHGRPTGLFSYDHYALTLEGQPGRGTTQTSRLSAPKRCVPAFPLCRILLAIPHLDHDVNEADLTL